MLPGDGEEKGAVLRSRWIVGFWLIAVVGSFLGTVCSFLLGHCVGMDAVLPVGTVAGVEARTRIDFPAGTELIEAKYQQDFMSPLLVARLRIPREKVESFLKGPPFLGQVSRSERNLEWVWTPPGWMRDWHPEKARDFIVAGACYEQSTHDIGVLVDLDDPDTALVYVTWTML